MSNRIGSNLGRAKVVTAADGRILSLISVEHLPLVRVDVRLYEVNLNRLREWSNDLNIILSDFDQGDLLPAAGASDLQGINAAFVGDDDVQNVLRFIDGGLNNQTQLVEGGIAVDDVFQLLITREIARAVSRPSLTVLSGELALFQVGGEVPVPVAVTVGGGTDQILNGVEFREFGVQLSIRPMVEENESELITLDLTPRVSLPDLQLTAALRATAGTDTGTTAFESRSARTHARLIDGQSSDHRRADHAPRRRHAGQDPGTGRRARPGVALPERDRPAGGARARDRRQPDDRPARALGTRACGPSRTPVRSSRPASRRSRRRAKRSRRRIRSRTRPSPSARRPRKPGRQVPLKHMLAKAQLPRNSRLGSGISPVHMLHQHR